MTVRILLCALLGCSGVAVAGAVDFAKLAAECGHAAKRTQRERSCAKLEKEIVRCTDPKQWEQSLPSLPDSSLRRLLTDAKTSEHLNAAIKTEQAGREARANLARAEVEKGQQARAAMFAKLRDGMTFEEVDKILGGFLGADTTLVALINGARRNQNSGVSTQIPYTSLLLRCTLVFDGSGKLIASSYER